MDKSSEVLQALAKSKKQEWEELQREHRRIEIQLKRSREYLESLNKLLTLEGLAGISIGEEAGPVRGFGSVGNKAPDMPLRRQEFEGKSLTDALLSILETAGAPMHADVLIERIYEIRGHSDMRKAKQSLVSTLASGVKAGKWNRVRPNTFAARASNYVGLFDAKSGAEIASR